MSNSNSDSQNEPFLTADALDSAPAPPAPQPRSPDSADSPSSPDPDSSSSLPDADDERASLKPSLARSTHSYGSTLDPDSASATVPYRRRRARQAGPSRLRSRLLCGLVTVLLGISIYGSFVDDFMGTVEDGISCGFCLGLLMPLQALAHLGDDAFVDLFVGFCSKLGVSRLFARARVLSTVS